MSGQKFEAIKKNLELLECPLLGNGEDWWLKDLLITPGQHKLQLLEWLLTKIDASLKQTILVDIAADAMPVAAKKINAVLSALGLNRKDDYGLFSNTFSVEQQTRFWRYLTDIVVTQQKYKNECNMTKENTELAETNCSSQYENCCVLIDTIAEQAKLPELFNTEINILPPDIMKEIAGNISESNSKTSPDLSYLRKQLEDTEDVLSKETTNLEELQKGQMEPTTKCEVTQEQLNHALIDFNKLCAVYSETYNNLKPWFGRSEPELIEFGPKLELICSQLNTWSIFKHTLDSVIQCCSKLKDLENCLKEQDVNKTSFSNQIKELNTLLQSIIEYNKECLSIANSTIISI